MSSKRMKLRPVTQCENCETPLQGEFCYVCGQRGVEIRRPVIGLAQDIIVETLSIDSKLWRTVVGLLVNPGKVAKAYISGKRARYSPPFRVYLFFSLVFFATFFLMISSVFNTNNSDDISDNEIQQEESLSPTAVEVEEDEPEPDNSEPDTGTASPSTSEEAPIDLTLNGEKIEIDEDGNFTYNGPAFLESTVRRIYENIQSVQEDPRLFQSNLRSTIPRVLLAMPVIYVLILLIFYFYKKNVFVYDLLIISLYMHAALYFYLFLGLVFQASPLDKMPIIGMGEVPLQLWGVFQSYRVLSTNFGSKWYSVLGKGMIINSTYWLITALLIVTGMALSLVY